MGYISNQDRDLAIFHLVFGLICALALWLGAALPTGWIIFVLILGYNIALPMFAWRWKYQVWRSAWEFGLLLSVFQILPDYFLADTLKTLVFPDTGFWFIGPVPAFMALLWVPIFVLCLYTGEQVREVRGEMAGVIASAAVALLVLGLAEATLWAVPIWHAQSVQTVARVAIYVWLAEGVLGAAVFIAWRSAGQSSWWRRTVAAFAVMLIYTGALAIFHLLIDRIAA